MRLAVVQLSSTDDLPANLNAAALGIARAAAMGAQLVALPENFAFMRREGSAFPCVQDDSGELVPFLTGCAREHGVWILGGSFPEAIEGDDRVHNTSVVVSPEGLEVARYRKIHLFDVDLGDGAGGRYRESAHFAPGDAVVVADTPFGGLGLSICYDLRFPELYRAMVDAGARLIAVPSAFTPETGKAHWEVLLRARAIETQCFVLAPAQCGTHSQDRRSHGHSMIVDPWGVVRAQAGDEPSVLVVDCDPGQVERVRHAIPVSANRRLGWAQSPE
jgi:nitrilase